MEASQKAKTITVKTLDGTMTRKKQGQEASVSISSKCADINADMLNSLGVSKPILNYVIFCHQEDSNWPLDVGSKVKERFDEIFNSVKYKNVLKNVKDVRKKEMDEAKIEKNNAAHYESDKKYADQKRKDMRRKQKEAEQLQTDIERIGEELRPLREQLLEVQEQEKGFSENQRLLAEATTSLEHCRKERGELEGSVGEVLPAATTDLQIRERIEGVDQEKNSKVQEVKKIERKKGDMDEDIRKVEAKSQKNAAVIGKAVTEQENFRKQERERGEVLETAGQELAFGEGEGDLLTELKNEHSRIQTQIAVLKTDFKKKEQELEEQVDEIKARKAGLEEKKKRGQGDMMVHKKEIAQLKRTLNDLAGSSEKLERIKKEWEEGDRKLGEERERFDLVELQEEVDREKETVGSLEGQEDVLKVEAREMEEQEGARKKIEHIKEDIGVKAERLNRVLGKRSEQMTKMFGTVPKPNKLRAEYKKLLESTEEKMKELEQQRKSREVAIDTKSSAKAELKRELEKKSSRRLELESKCSDVIDTSGDLEEEIQETKESLEAARRELQVKEAGKFVYKEQVEMLRRSSAPPCPTCNRELGRKGEAEEVIQGLEEQTRAIPAKVRSLEAKVVKQSGRLEALHSIRPDLQMLKQLGQEVQEAELKMKQLEKAVKGLRTELEVEEGEYATTEELVLELREVGEDVQVVDSLRREVEQLEEKLSELGGEVREGGAGARSLDSVRREAEVVSRKLRSARANLTSCQETVSRQSSLINRLEARQNRLTQDKLEIEGQQQRRAQTEAKREELEGRVLECGEEVKRSEGELVPLREQLEEVEG